MLSARNISLSYGSGPLVVNGMDVDLGPNEIVALLGPSGCGKSTVLRALAGLHDIQSGNIQFEQDCELAFVFQDAALMPWATVTDNVGLPNSLKGKPNQLSIKTALEDVGLAGLENRFPAQLSGGQRMRVSVARALSVEPNVLLMDEPFAALDEVLRFQMNELVLRLVKDRALSVLFVTHSLYEAAYLADRILVMNNGQIAAQFVPDLDRSLPPVQQRASARFVETIEALSSHLEAASQ